MKAHSLKQRISWAMNCECEVYTDLVAKEQRLAVRSALGPKQIEQLRVLIEAYGWHLAYERIEARGFSLHLAILPNHNEVKEVAKL